MTSPGSPVRVLYIAGAGRSGSTILGAILGSHDSICNAGELAHVPRNAWYHDEYCACGERGSRCPFWSDVRRRWARRIDGFALDDYLALQDRFCRLRSLVSHLKAESRSPSREFIEYGRYTVALYETIREVSGKDIVLDMSKNPARAMSLSLIPGIALRVVHLVRDGRGYVWSHRKSYSRNDAAGLSRDFVPQPVWRTAARWRVVNSATDRVVRRLGRSTLRVYYENLVEDPPATLGRIGKIVELNLAPLGAPIAGGERVAMGHVVAGNRVRMAGSVTLSADFEWRDRLPLSDRILFWMIAGRLARRYGYTWI
jgi:hypothetical protein